MEQILVIEDNPDYRELLQNFLENAGYSVTIASDGVEALVITKKQVFDLILLDIMLPKIDGYGVCEVIRKESNVPIIILTALDSEAHQVRGFDLCIDDYITKPVSMPILIHKVAAVLRRSISDVHNLRYGNIVIDIKSHSVSILDNPIDFTLREYEILQELMRRPGEVVTRKRLLSKIWNYDFYGDERIIDTHIKNIRRKLGVEDCIETIRGVGYKLPKEN